MHQIEASLALELQAQCLMKLEQAGAALANLAVFGTAALLSVPLAAWIIGRVHHVERDRFYPAAARAAISGELGWTKPERRLVPVVVLALALWLSQPLIEPLFPKGAITDGTIAAVIGLTLSAWLIRLPESQLARANHAQR